MWIGHALAEGSIDSPTVEFGGTTGRPSPPWPRLRELSIAVVGNSTPPMFARDNATTAKARGLELLIRDLLAPTPRSHMSDRISRAVVRAPTRSISAGPQVIRYVANGIELHLGRIDKVREGKRFQAVEIRWQGAGSMPAIPESMRISSADEEVLSLALPACAAIEAEAITEWIPIVTRGANNRRWFCCPAVYDGRSCGKLTPKLHSGFAAPGFRCRKCSAGLNRKAHAPSLLPGHREQAFSRGPSEPETSQGA